MTCHGSPARIEWMAPSLDQPPNTFPDWLPKLADREIDVAFTGCAQAFHRPVRTDAPTCSRLAADEPPDMFPIGGCHDECLGSALCSVLL